MTLDDVLALLKKSPSVEEKLDYGIGIVGAGHIVNWAHLPAYRKAGFNVVGLYDVAKDKAMATAEKYEVPKVYNDLDELTRDPEVEVVDMALPPNLNLVVGEKVLSAKKHMICHKPMALQYAEAVKLVESAKKAGVKFAVNQNLRWSPAMWSCRQLVRGNVLGSPVAGFIDHSFGGDLSLLGETWPPYYMQPLRYLYAKPKVVYDPPQDKTGGSRPSRTNILGDGVHIIDSLRVLFGMPKSVITAITGIPSSPTADTVNTIILDYGTTFSIAIRLTYNNWWGGSHLRFSFEGTNALIRGSVGDYSRNFFKEAISPNDELEVAIRDRPVTWIRPSVRGTWIPDAFVYSMGELLQSVKHDTQPEHSGEDNLSTLRIIHAALESADSGMRVKVK